MERVFGEGEHGDLTLARTLHEVMCRETKHISSGKGHIESIPLGVYVPKQHACR